MSFSGVANLVPSAAGAQGVDDASFRQLRWANGPLFRCDHGRADGSEYVIQARLAPSSTLPAALKNPARATDAALAAIPGDWAFAAFDCASATLRLGLAALSELELFYVRQGADIAFATDLSDLASPLRPSLAELAKRLHFPAFFEGDGTGFEDVHRVVPGTLVEISAANLEVSRFWQLPETDPDLDLRTASAALAAALEQSVADRLSLVEGPVATMLSAGRDSSAVTLTAARLLAERGQRLTSFTASPEPGGPSLPGILIDESAVATRTAGALANVDHLIRRPRPLRLCERLDRIHRTLRAPILQPVAMSWCEDIYDDCEDCGIALLLTGDLGNLALSLGGPQILRDVAKADGKGPWLRTALRMLIADWRSARSVLRSVQRPQTVKKSAPVAAFLKGELAEQYRLLSLTDVDLPDTYLEWLRKGLLGAGLPTSLAGLDRGLTLSDPTADPNLVRLVHALRPSLLASPSSLRPLFEQAFPDLPIEVHRPRHRGMQNIDWHRSFDLSDIREGVRRYGEVALVRRSIDIDALLGALEDWPSERQPFGARRDRFIWGVLPALAVASFLAANG